MNVFERPDFASKIVLTFGDLIGVRVSLVLHLILIIELVQTLMNAISLKILDYALEHAKIHRVVIFVLVHRDILLVLMKGAARVYFH